MKQQLYKSISRFALRCALVFSILLGLNVSAQTYPVQTNIYTSGPYFNYLSYYGDQNNHLQVMVTFLDFTLPPVMARLRIRIEGPGYEMYTNPAIVVGQPFLLESGVPQYLSGIDLQPYLQQNNLIISPQGVDINDLPEGFTTICVDVIKDGTNQEVLSTDNCTGFPLNHFGVPSTYAPICSSVLTPEQQFYQFNWSEPMGYVPDGTSSLRYNYALYRWVDTNNFSIFQAAPFQGQTSMPQPIPGANLVAYHPDLISNILVINDLDIPFELGQHYVWYVQAVIETVNGSFINMMPNSGISTPCTFRYGEALSLNDVLSDGLSIDLFADPSSETKGRAYWKVNDATPNSGLSNFDQFFLEYRKQPTGNEGFEIPWFSATVTDTFDFVYQLEPSTTYEVKVSGIIGGVVGDPTPVETFTTLAPRVYNCGESDLPFLPSTYTPLENALVGTQVKIGQFMMTMTQVNALGAAGHYAGKGEIPIAFLMGAKAKVTFSDIFIDSEYRVRTGRVDVITEGLANWLDDQMMQFIDPYYVDGTIDSAWVDTTAGVAWVVVDGVPQDFVFDPPNYPIIVNDASGNQYTIYPNGVIVVGTYLSVSETWAVAANETVRFGQNDSEERGFDPKEHQEWHENYETMKLSDNTFYYVANKSLAKSEGDMVNVQFPANVTHVRFELPNGDTIPYTDLQGSWMGTKPYLDSGLVKTLYLPSFSSGGKYEVSAFVDGVKSGQLNIQVYGEKTKEVVVVPIASISSLNIDATEIENELKRTLGEANITIDVTLEDPWTDSTGTFTATTNISLPTEVGLLTKYSDDMRDLRDAYFEQHPNASKSKYYVFLVNGFDDPSQLGYMVRGRSMGFVKASSSTTQAQVLQTISHELGHGMGALEHTFKNEVIAQGSTNNLMDYSGETNLTIAQWKELRDLDLAPSLLDAAEDGSSLGQLGNNWVAMDSPYRNPTDSTMCFLAPNNKVVKLPKNVVKFSQSDGNDSFYEAPPMMATGLLMSFHELIQQSNGEFLLRKYKADILDGEFGGYVIENHFNTDSLSDEYIVNFFGKIEPEFLTTVPILNEGAIYDNYKTKDANSDFGVIGFTNHLNQRSMYEFETSTYNYIESYQQANGTVFEIKGINASECIIKGAPLTFLKNENIQGEYDYQSFDIMQITGAQNINEEIFIISKICELRSRYPDLYDQMSETQFNQWQTTANFGSQIWINLVNATDLLYSNATSLLAEDSLVNSFYKNGIAANKQFFDQYYYEFNLGSRPKKEVWMRFLNCYSYLIKNFQLVFADDIQAINNIDCQGTGIAPLSLSADRIITLTELMSTDEISGLCVRRKISLINKLLNPNNFSTNPLGIVWDKYEVAILKLLKNTTIELRDDLLEGLCTTESQGKLLIQRMVDGIDDETCWIGSNNFTELLNWMITTFNQVTNHDLQVFTGGSGTPTNQQIALLQKRTITYNYTGFVKRLFTSPITSSGDMMTDVYMGSDNQVKVKNYLELQFFDVGSAPVRSLNPLAPVVIVDNSNLVDLYEGNGSNKGGFIAPAIVLYFLESKATAQTTQAVIQTVADVASLAIPGAGAYKLLTYADKVSSMASIAGSYYQDNNPELAKYLNLSSSILGLGSMTLSVTNFRSISSTDDAVGFLNNNGANFNQFTNVDQSANVLEFKNRVKRAVDPYNSNLSSTQAAQRLEDLDVLSSQKSKALLVTTIENEISVAKAGGHSGDVANLEYALSKVKNFGPFDYSFHSFYKKLEDKASNWTDNLFYKNSSKNTLIAQVEPEGLILHQVTPTGQIPDNATLIAVVENTEYRMVQDANFTNNADVYIYQDGNDVKVFCLGNGNCFVGNTDISTMSGVKKIAEIEVGDSVLSYDEGTQTTVFSRVKKLFKKNTTSLIRLIAGADTLWTTPDHRFLTKQGWKTARNLVIGVSLITSNGTLAVNEVQLKDSIAEVYNFEVENTHTYIVGANQMVVHNDCQSTVNSLLTSNKLDPDDVTSFVSDFENSTALLNKFESGELRVDAWRVLSEAGSTLRTNEAAVKFFNRIDDAPALRTKLLNDLDDTEISTFLDDFGDISSVDRAVFNQNPELLESWKVLINGNAKLRTLENIDIVNSYKNANSSATFSEIHNAFDGLKASRREAFINGLENVTDNASLSLTNKRLASVEEIKNAVNDLRIFRSNNPSVLSGSNIGKLEGTVNGQGMSQLSDYSVWISGDPTPLLKPYLWQAQDATNSVGATYFRNSDSEYKMLNDLARELEPNAIIGQQYLGHSGDLRIISEIPYCSSCAGIIQKFNQMFPNIQIVLIDGIK